MDRMNVRQCLGLASVAALLVASVVGAGCDLPDGADADPTVALNQATVERLLKHRDVDNSDYDHQPHRVRDVWVEYQANEARGNAKFLGRYVIVYGQVDRVEEDRIEFVTAADEFFASIDATFAKVARHTLPVYDPGDAVLISCECQGLFLDSMLTFEDCIPLTGY